MIPDPPANTITRPYRGLSVQEVESPLTEPALAAYLLGREVYRRTDYLVLRNGTEAALVAVRRATNEPLFSPVVEARLLAGPDQVAWIEDPDTDVSNATALAWTARRHARHGIRAWVVRGRYEHVNFIWQPAPLRVRVTEVVPPEPPKLHAMAHQALAFDEDLPPIELILDAVDVRRLAAATPAPSYLLPCRGSGIEIDLGGPVAFLDTRPARRRHWVLIGCERSMQFHRHFYGDEPSQVDLCPRNRALDASPGGGSGTGGGPTLTLTKCCLLERGVQLGDGTAVVPWGANLDEVRVALRHLAGLDQPNPTPATVWAVAPT